MQFNLINAMNLAILILLLLPNLWYARRGGPGRRCSNRVMNALEQVGRYACILLMVVPLGVWEFGFSRADWFVVYLFGNGALLLADWLIWIRFFRRPSRTGALALAALPTASFLLTGLTLGHGALVGAAAVFGVGHLYVTARTVP